MKNILITGKNSYIGTSLENWLKKEPSQYEVDTVDMENKSWKEKDFSLYDVVFHVAGLAHIKETKENQALYYEVNRDLAYETAKKAKTEGVKQFIFLSSMSVYGINNGIINENTTLKPKTAYGKSKIEAEELINQLKDDSFTIATIRPPMVYGKGCKGNYPRLANLALKVSFFPSVKNKRSMIFINNLSEFVKNVIDYELEGLFFPQNKEYINTTELVQLISIAHGKELKVTVFFNPLVNLGIKLSETFCKVFGSFFYDKGMPGGPLDKFDYETCSFEESIRRTEK